MHSFYSEGDKYMSNVLLTLAVVVTMGGTPIRQVGPQHQTSNMAMMQSCPMKVTGADVSVADVENGVAVTITTKSGDIAELRRRTENMAKMHSGSTSADMHGQMMSFTVKYEEVPNGARLTLTPKDSAQLSDFRSKVRQHAEQMAKGDCSMMQGMMMHGMMGGMKNAEPTPKTEPKPQPDDADHSAHHPPGDKK
jgi:hypothetical protein